MLSFSSSRAKPGYGKAVTFVLEFTTKIAWLELGFCGLVEQASRVSVHSHPVDYGDLERQLRFAPIEYDINVVE